MHKTHHLSSPFGAVSGGHQAVVEAGGFALEQGGNAVDAALAAFFTAFHAEAMLSSVSGCGFLLADVDGASIAYDFGAAAPGLGAKTPLYTPPEGAFHAIEVDFGAAQQTFHVGPGSVAVPSALDGLMAAHSDLGQLPLEILLKPAINAARQGTLVTSMVELAFTLLDAIIRSTPEMETFFAKSETESYARGDLFKNETLARFYEALVSGQLPASFKHGPLAEALINQMETLGGGVTRKDLESYQVRRLEPLRHVVSQEFELLLTPPPSSGGMLIAYDLSLLEGRPVPTKESVDEVLLLRAVMAEVNLARQEIIGAKTPSRAHVEQLLSDAQLRLGSSRVEGAIKAGPGPLPPAKPLVNPHGSTTHVSAVDAKGNACSVTISNGECSGVLLEEWGVPLNNFLGEEDLNPAGFHKFPAGARLGSTMTPCILKWRGDSKGRVSALGSGGSNRIRNALLQVIRNLSCHHLPGPEAIVAPRVHQENLFYAEAVDELEHAVQALEEAGTTLSAFPERHMFFGGVHLAERLADGRFCGTGDRRRSGAAWTRSPEPC